MKRLFLLTLSAFSWMAAGAVTPPAIVPMPQHVVCGEGESVQLPQRVRIAVPRAEKALRGVAEVFAGEVSRESDLRAEVTAASGGDIVLAVDPGLAPEAYRLDIASGRVAVRGGTAAGVFYGLQTLRQMLAQYGTTLPAVSVADEPCFAYRGAMLDCCRHFFSVEEVKTFIDMLALHKLNRFHWHLTDDQGWRIEIRRYPALTKVGARRAETVIGRNSDEYDGTPYGGYYTQKQIREVVAYAAARFVTVIPEIEMPGHASAALTAYPWLGCAGSGYKVQTLWGVFPEVFCVGRESTFEFLENVLGEVLDLFPSEYIHVGGDECPRDNWKTCPACQQRMCDEHLGNEAELQSYLVNRIERWLNDRGRRLIGWDEILEGGVSKTATVMSWRGAAGGIAAAKAGNKVIMAPNTHCYLDYYQTADPEKLEPLGIGGYVPVSKVYSLDPCDQLSASERPYILGVQGNLWAEYIPAFPHAQHMLLPRLAALCEVGWSYDRRDFPDFRRRMNSLRKMYDRCGYPYAPYFFDGTDE